VSTPTATDVPVAPGASAHRLVASDPLVLDQPGQAWFLTSGEVDLFVVPTDDLGRPGRRSFLASAGPGTLLLGAAPAHTEGQTWRLTAVGVDAVALLLDDEWVASLGANPTLELGLHGWLSATGSALDALGPRRAVSPGEVVTLAVGQVLNAPRGLAWLLPDDTSDAVLAVLGRMQSGLWDRLLALPVAFFGRHSVADLAVRLNAVETIQDTVSGAASRTLLAVVTLLFSLGLLFTYSAGLALAVVSVTVVVLGLGVVITLAQLRLLTAMYQAKGRSSSVLLQIVKGNEKIHAAAAEDRALDAWAARFADQSRLLLASWQWGAARTALYALLPSALTLVIFTVVLRDPATLSTAAFLAFVAALGQVASATAQLDQGVGSALTIVTVFRALEPILAEPPEVGAGAADPGPLDGRIALSSVRFRYPGMDRPTLQDVSLTVEPGEFVAVVGTSGSGKSTIVRLLLGFEGPDAGSVTYDGKDLQSLDIRAVREQIGVALQNANLAGADIFAVIAGDRPLTEEEAMAAAERVGLADDIRALPSGLRTRIGDGGETFSGGQRQRMVLAAAVARTPRVVILDEATSALDSVAQAVVAASFGALQVTRVVVAHRLSTIRHADRVVVMDAGRIVQEGTFDELAEQAGVFRDMVQRQTFSSPVSRGAPRRPRG